MSSRSPASPRDDTSRGVHFSPGDVVTDRELSSDQRGVVVNTPPKAASEWYITNQRTVATDNPDYPDDDPVVVIVWEDDLSPTFRYYTGYQPIPLRQLNAYEIPHYTFPASRLSRVTPHAPADIPIDRIDPSPYHARTFDASENRTFINEAKERGEPPTPPHLRATPSEDRLEIINGHKRVWVGHLAGLDTIRCWVSYRSRSDATREWASEHLGAYTTEQARVSIERLCDDFSEKFVESVVPHHHRSCVPFLNAGASE